MCEVKCKICEANSLFLFKKTILGKYEVSYYQCPQCDFLQVEEPFWLEEAYKTPINIFDTGIMQRNFQNASITALLIKFLLKKKLAACDYAGGYGVFVRLMRDWGFDFLWMDSYAQNLFAREFEWNKKDSIDLFTCFECLEHFSNPLNEITKITNKGEVSFFCTTQLLPKKEEISSWWYLGLEHGQHLSFYSKKTLEVIAARLGMNIYSVATFHFFSKNQISFPIYWGIIKCFPRLIATILFLKKTGAQLDHEKIVNQYKTNRNNDV